MVILFITGLIAAYFIGSIPTAYIVGRLTRNIDLRKHGSGNVGATNAFRVLGVRWGFFVLACDILKGFIVVTVLFQLCANFFKPVATANEWLKIAMGLSAIAGHNWTIFLRFKGGKGIAISTGVFLGVVPGVVGLCAIVWGAMFLIFRYVSLASITCAVFAPIGIIILCRNRPDFSGLLVISIILASCIVYTHRSNIKRLLRGEEGRVRLGKRKD